MDEGGASAPEGVDLRSGGPRGVALLAALFVIVREAACDYSGMVVFRSALVAALSLVASSTLALDAHAETSVQLAYAAPEGCPSRAQFEAAVQERGGRFDLPPSDVVGSELHVTLRTEGAAFSGSLEVEGAVPAAGLRQVHAAACDEAMHGIAVITALLLRPAQSEAPAPSPLPDVPAPSAVPDAATPAAAPPASRLRSVGWWDTESMTVGAGTLTFDNSVAYTLTGGVDVGWIPSVVLPRYDLTVSRANIVTTPDGNRYLVSGVLPRARWTVLGGGSYQFGDVSTQLLGFRAAFGSCYSFGFDLGGLSVLACGEIAAGILQLDTQDAAGTKLQSKTVGLGTVGLELEVQYRVGSLFHIDLRAGGDFGSADITAERADGSEIFRTFPASAHFAAGFGLHF